MLELKDDYACPILGPIKKTANELSDVMKSKDLDDVISKHPLDGSRFGNTF